jgi:uncharacterized membrane protein
VKRQEHHAPATVGEHVADAIAAAIGSWRFLGAQTAIVVCWIVANVWLLRRPFDPYPLILLNLVFSTQAAYTGPILLLAGNRAAQRDRAIAARDDEEIGLIAALQQEQMPSHKEQLRLLRLLTEHAGLADPEGGTDGAERGRPADAARDGG